MNMLDYLVISCVNLIMVIAGYVLAKPWFDRRVAKALQPPQLPQKGSTQDGKSVS